MSHTGNVTGSFSGSFSGHGSANYSKNDLFDLQDLQPLLWLDTSDISTIIAEQGAVSQWRDKSKYKQNFSQTVGSQRPRLSTAENLPALLFDGLDDNLAAVSTAQNYAYPYTALFLVSASSFSIAYNTLFDSYQDGAGTSPGAGFFVKSNGKSAFYGVSTTIQPNYDGTGAITYQANNPFLIAFSIADNSINSWGNGVDDGIMSSTFINKTTPVGNEIYLGAGVRFSRYTPWLYREALFIPRISTVNRQIAEGVLCWKRGLQNILPASHPYRNRPPLVGD